VRGEFGWAVEGVCGERVEIKFVYVVLGSAEGGEPI
jgi:hypothetical protein